MEVFGLVVSVIGVSETLIKGTKALKSIKDALADAPEELERLYLAMTRLQSIFAEIRALGSDHDDAEGLWAHTPHLADTWAEHVKEIEADILMLEQRVEKLRQAFAVSSRTSKNVRARFKKMFSDHELERYERLLSGHQETFSFMLNVISERRQRKIMSELKKQTQFLHQASQIPAPQFTGLIQVTNHTTSVEFNTFIGSSSMRRKIANELEALPCEHNAQQDAKMLLSAVVQSPQSISSQLLTASKTVVESPVPEVAATAMALAARPTQAAMNLGIGVEESDTVAFGLQCHVFGYCLPIGTVYGRRDRKVCFTEKFGKTKTSHGWHLDFVLHPLSFLTETVYRIQLDMSPSGRFSVSPMRYTYNSRPELKTCLDRGDVDGICQLFADDLARPDNLIAPWGNTLLHEAVVRHCIGVPNMLQLVEILLKNGVDPNMLNHRKRTALTLTCHLMQESPSINSRLLPLAGLLISHHADLSILDEDGNSCFMLIFRTEHGLSYIEDFVYRYIGLDTYSDVKSLDLWLMTSVARTMPAFRARLEAENRSFRSEACVSSSVRPRQDRLLEHDPDEQVAWLRAASPKERYSFLSLLFSFGSLDMVAPFIDPSSGLDMDETIREDEGRYSSKSYIRTAARMGNLDVVVALAEAGARLEQADWRWRASNLCTSVLEELVERWCFMSYMPVQGKTSSVQSELWMLRYLLEKPGHESPNALYTALSPEIDASPIVTRLLEHGHGRRDGQADKTQHDRWCGSEVLEAVKHGMPYLQAMLDHGLAIESEDQAGVTAVLYAVDNAEVDMLRRLVKAGANLTRRPGCGVSAVDLANSNLRAGHPRPTNRAWRRWCWLKTDQDTITLEEDEVIWGIVMNGKEGRELPLLLPPRLRERRRWYSQLSLLNNPELGLMAAAIFGILLAVHTSVAIWNWTK